MYTIGPESAEIIQLRWNGEIWGARVVSDGILLYLAPRLEIGSAIVYGHRRIDKSVIIGGMCSEYIIGNKT